MTHEMTMSLTVSSAATLFMLGGFHGINPGMGWLLAVALGMQEHRRAAVWRALLPLGAGHALAIAGAAAVALLAGAVVPIHMLRWIVAAVLIGLGASRLIRHRHPRWAGMRVGMWGLLLWSFLMASAHGAGLMVLPVFINMAAPDTHAACHTFTATTPAAAAVLGSLVHALGYLAVSAAVALLVFDKLGLGLLRKAWFNLDLIWAGTLIATGLVTALS